MRDLQYAAPRSIDEAVRLLQGNARPLAGGTDLIDQVRIGKLTPDLFVDIKKIPELNLLEAGPGGLRIGAAVPCYRIARHAEIRARYHALADSAGLIGGTQIQSRASFGGNLCNSGPAADATPSLIALSATCVIAGPQGRRTVPVEAFCTGPGQNVLTRGELLVELTFPAPPPHSGSAYLRFIPRNEMDIAVVGVGASVVLDAQGAKIVSARIGLGAVAPTPLLADEAARLLAGAAVDDASLEKAAAAAVAITRPIDDMRGTVEFRRHVTGVLVARALKAAIDRAKGSS